MQINTNTTGMQAALTIATDKDGRDHCVVVVKGTFVVGPGGEAVPSETQEPPVVADVHHGDPTTSSVKYECEFALFKPRADVLVNGQAVAPEAKPVKELTVVLEIGSIRKEVRVIGDRRWDRGILGLRASNPVPFVTMPLTFERAFGGSDLTHPNLKHRGAELRNLVGVGFHKNSDTTAIEASPLPNLEHPRHLISTWSDTPPPVGFGVVGRTWLPRVKYAGTYDQRWLDERFPFLPEDFDQQYFLAAPADQQVPFFRGGEVVRCINMTATGSFEISVPRFDIPIRFRFRDRDMTSVPNLDTLIIEPEQNRFLAVWRASAPLVRKPNALREVIVGLDHGTRAKSPVNGKTRHYSLQELTARSRRRVTHR
jgi:hypothetical protein